VYAVILASLFGIAVGRIPRWRMNRASIAFTGAAFLVALGALPLEKALDAIDLGTLILILSMMIITANLKLAGFFELAGTVVLRAARTPKKLLALIMAAAALLSALFLNDTICIMLTPLVAGLLLRAKRNPVPYLIALALAANIGSAATIIGNPQNMLIGAASGISFGRFLARLAPPTLLSIVAAYLIVVLVFRTELSGRILPGDGDRHPAVRVYPPLLYKSLGAVAVMTVGFMIEAPIVAAALLGAALLLTTRRVNPERVFAELDWTIIAFFGGLFIITAAVAETEAFRYLIAWGFPAIGQSAIRFSLFTVVLSNLVSNVPAVMLLRPLTGWFTDPEQAWLVMAMASTYAGNLTLLGSVANLIVAEISGRYGIKIGFGTYLKVGLPTTVVTVLIGTVYLAFGPRF